MKAQLGMEAGTTGRKSLRRATQRLVVSHFMDKLPDEFSDGDLAIWVTVHKETDRAVVSVDRRPGAYSLSGKPGLTIVELGGSDISDPTAFSATRKTNSGYLPQAVIGQFTEGDPHSTLKFHEIVGTLLLANRVVSHPQ